MLATASNIAERVFSRRAGNGLGPRGVPSAGFTLIELVLVIVLLGLIGAVALPRWADVERSARIAKLQDISRTMNSTVSIVRAKAAAAGLAPVASNPGGSQQTSFAVDFGFGTTEVDWRNLCPESRAEVADSLTMLDFITVDSTGTRLLTDVGNRFTRVGFDLSTCYVEYDSFACTVQIVSSDCAG
jgi:MSHA pilin protein MshA